MMLRNDATESPFSSEYNDNDIYIDVVSGEPLFSSKINLMQECGWPVFLNL